MSFGEDGTILGEDEVSMKDDEAFAQDQDEFEKLLNERHRRVSGKTITALVVAGVVVVGVALAWGLSGLGNSAAAEGAPGASASPSAADPDPGPAPSDPATPRASDETPTPGPDEPEEASPDARETLPPVALGAPVSVEGGPTVSVSSVESVEGQAVLPGEVSGPAVRVTVRVENDSDETIDLTTAVVTLYAGESNLQASPITKPAGKAFPADVAPGEIAEGAFVFELPENERADVRVEVDLSVSDPLVAFSGDIE